MVNHKQKPVQKIWTPDQIQKIASGRDLIISPAEAPELLQTIGILSADHSMPRDNVRKFIQVNHMVRLLGDDIKDLCKRFSPVVVVDAACGNSYLSLILAWVTKHKWGHPFRIIGCDTNADTVARSNERANALGLGDIATYVTANLKEFNLNSVAPELPRPHFVMALHACDTASDHAIALGIRHGADVIGVAPCCQRELAQIWKTQSASAAPALKPLFASPHLRHEIAGPITDALRMQLLRAHGYEVTAKEFVSPFHSPKNTLLSAVRRGRFHDGARAEYEAMRTHFGGATITLHELLVGNVNSPGPSANTV